MFVATDVPVENNLPTTYANKRRKRCLTDGAVAAQAWPGQGGEKLVGGEGEGGDNIPDRRRCSTSSTRWGRSKCVKVRRGRCVGKQLSAGG